MPTRYYGACLPLRIRWKVFSQALKGCAMEGFRGFINPCHISVEEEYTFLIRPFLVSSPPFMSWIPPSSQYSSRCPSSSCCRTRLVCCLDGSAFIPPWTLQR